MDPERWKQIEELYHSVLDRQPGDRSAFLDQAAAEDPALRREVETLIAYDQNASQFIEGPALEIAAKALAEDQTIDQAKIRTREQIGPYDVISRLGAGGMGEVYLAEDLRLGRKVALKLLPQLFAEDEERVRRFQQEARAVSALNHPNIITIYEVGQADELCFIATEFIDGQSLRQRMAVAPINLREALDIAIEVASALVAAHEAGIVHRDIKPENIMLRRDGYIKVLDFGLAKLIKPLSTDADTVADSEESAVEQFYTRPGWAIGTPRYMSPEQIRAQPVDGRSDIFSLGVVLYELVAGRVPFEGATPSDIIVSILKEKPSPLTSHRPGTPAGVQRVVGKMLQKHREERYQTSRHLLIDLKSLKHQVEKARYEPLAQSGLSGRTTVSIDYGQQEEVQAPKQLMILYKRSAQPDEQVLTLLEKRFLASGHRVFIDRHLTTGMQWASEIEHQVRTADAIVVLLSEASISSEMLANEVQIAHEAAELQQGKPRLLPVRLKYDGPLPDALSGILNPLHYAVWNASQDDEPLVTELLLCLEAPLQRERTFALQKLESAGGAVPLDSEFYIVRPTDEEFRFAISNHDSIVLVKGARQMGKTSLLARGLNQARETGAKIVLTDFQKLNASHLASPDALFLALAEMIADQLDIDVLPEDVWNARRGASMNFERYLRREVLDKFSTELVWGLDEVDRLFTCNFGSDVFGLFRSWHNERSLDPTGPWRRLTLAIAYATEAHLFITDMNQSPFNVGTKLVLEDFTLEQVAELNRRYGSPLRDHSEVKRYYRLVGGQPYLVRRGLQDLANRNIRLDELEAKADRDEGPFGDHLRRILFVLAQDPALCGVVREVLQGRPCPSEASFYRLRSAGLMSGDSARDVKLRCQLYSTYLERHLL